MPAAVKVHRLFQRMRFGIFALFGLIVLSTSLLCIRTVDTELSAEYAANSQSIAKTIADSSVDILLNRNLATLQSLIDQFVEVQGIRYIYITDETGAFLAHTFVPGIPTEILEGDPFATEPVERAIPGMGDFLEVGSPILAGVAGTVHLGMDLDLVALKIQRAIGQQVVLISILLLGGILASNWLVNLVARPLAELLAYAVESARHAPESGAPAAGPGKLLERDDEVGQIARLILYLSRRRSSTGPDALPSAPESRSAA